MNKADNFGIVHNLPFEEYQQISALNQSTLKRWFSSTPKSNDGYKNLQALRFGSAGHCLLLEPELFPERYARAPDGMRQRGKIGKIRWLEFAEQNPGKIMLQANEWERLQNIQTVFEIHPQIQKLWSKGNSEVSLFWQDSEFGLDCKARMDWYDPDSGVIVDLKFTNHIGKADTQKPLQDFYAVQATWYIRGVSQLSKNTADFFFVFIEKYAPHQISIVPVSADDLVLGKQKIALAIKNISNSNN